MSQWSNRPSLSRGGRAFGFYGAWTFLYSSASSALSTDPRMQVLFSLFTQRSVYARGQRWHCFLSVVRVLRSCSHLCTYLVPVKRMASSVRVDAE